MKIIDELRVLEDRIEVQRFIREHRSEEVASI